MKEKEYTVIKDGVKLAISATSRRTARKIAKDTFKRIKKNRKKK